MDSMFELYGDVTGNCLRAAIALEEAGIPYRAKRLELRQAEHREPGYLALNPEGKVPLLVDHSGTEPIAVSQSNAIMLYAAALKPGTILPAEPGPSQALALQVYFYFVTEVITVFFDSFVMRRHHELNASKLLQERGFSALMSAERHVNSSRFMAGETFTIADIAALTVTSSYVRHIPWEELPGLQRWYQAAMIRPGVQRGLQAFGPN